MTPEEGTDARKTPSHLNVAGELHLPFVVYPNVAENEVVADPWVGDSVSDGAARAGATRNMRKAAAHKIARRTKRFVANPRFRASRK